MPTKVKAVSAAMDRPNSSAQGCGMAGTSTMGAASMWAISATAGDSTVEHRRRHDDGKSPQKDAQDAEKEVRDRQPRKL